LEVIVFEGFHPPFVVLDFSEEHVPFFLFQLVLPGPRLDSAVKQFLYVLPAVRLVAPGRDWLCFMRSTRENNRARLKTNDLDNKKKKVPVRDVRVLRSALCADFFASNRPARLVLFHHSEEVGREVFHPI
jgi:hypothetical protein